jgi:4-hydroxybenzoate polyprenyltransferase
MLAFTGGLHLPYVVGVVSIAGLLIYEHALLRPSDLSKLDMAFFNLNGYVSVAFVVAVALDVWVGRP